MVSGLTVVKSHVLQVVAGQVQLVIPVANPTKAAKEGNEGAGEFDIAIWVADAVEAEILDTTSTRGFRNFRVSLRRFDIIFNTRQRCFTRTP